ncbi:hypothetical protein ACTGV8_11300, partial [Streptococcus suis]
MSPPGPDRAGVFLSGAMMPTWIIAALCVLISFSSQAQSLLTRLGDTGGDTITRVAAATLYDTRIVTGTVNGTDPLTLTSWDVTRAG